ncbi:glycosyltransferase family 1 protein, partial [bacterium]|nr:glycosyltransferase family 1 protein [bacterium]
ELKASCHIFVDQLGELGYGISGLESLAMGIPTVVQLLPDHEKFIGEHPFVVADSENLPEILETLATNPDLREGKSAMGREWVKRFHDPNRAIDIILKKYAELGWLSAGEFK